MMARRENRNPRVFVSIRGVLAGAAAAIIVSGLSVMAPVSASTAEVDGSSAGAVAARSTALAKALPKRDLNDKLVQ